MMWETDDVLQNLEFLRGGGGGGGEGEENISTGFRGLAPLEIFESRD